MFSSVFLMTFGSLLHGCPYEVWHLPLMLLEWDSFIKSMVSQTPHKIFLSQLKLLAGCCRDRPPTVDRLPITIPILASMLQALPHNYLLFPL